MSRHWTDPYLGRPHMAGRYECMDLVVEVLGDVFDVRLDLPPWAATARGRDAQVASLAAVLARPVAPPREGDGCLMKPAGRRVGAHHVGVAACVDLGRPHVLHCAPGMGVCLHPADRLPLAGFELAGWYRWLPSGEPALNPDTTFPRRRGRVGAAVSRSGR